MSIVLFRIVAWSLTIGIVILTVVPPSLRVVTGAPHDVEHAMVFLITGIAFGLGYKLRLSIICAAGVAFCAGLELIQLAVPGRHASTGQRFLD
jgi:hypothetical protein